MDLKALAKKPSTRKYALGIGIAIALFALLGFLAVPPILKSVLTKQLTQTLHREVSIREVQFNPFVLALKINGFTMKERGGAAPFVSFEELYLNFQLASAYRRGPVLRDVILKSPRISIVRNEDLRYNFSDLLEEFASKPGAPPSKPMRFSLNNIEIVDGGVDFDDRPKGTRHTVRDLRVAVPFVSNLPYYVDTYVQPVFLAKINGTPVALYGKTKPFSGSRETSFDVNVDDFDVPYYLNYVPVKLGFRIASARVDTRAILSFREFTDRPPVLAFTGQVALKALSITDLARAQVFSLPLLDVRIASSDVFSKKAELSSVLVRSPDLRVRRDREGKLNLASMLPKTAADNAAAAEKGKAGKEKESSPFTLEAAEIRLADGKISFEDLFPEKPFRTSLEGIEVTVRHFSNAPGKKTAVEAAFRTEAGETFTHSGELAVEPFAAEGTVGIGKVPLKKYSPYYAGMVLFDVGDGVLDLSTRYRHAGKEGGGDTVLSGLGLELRSLRLRKRGEAEDFLDVPLLAVKDAEIGLGSRTLTVAEFATSKGKILVRRGEGGAVNLAGLVPPGEPAKKDPGAGPRAVPSRPWTATVKKVLLDRYSLRIEDDSTADPVRLTAVPVSFSAREVSTRKNSRGSMTLKARIGEGGSLDASGYFGLDPVSADLKLAVKAFDIVPLQPYFTDRMKIIVTKGDVSASGALGIATARDGSFGATYKGEATLARLSSLDKASAEEFVKWDSLHLGEIDVSTNPLQVSVGDISLTDFYSRIAIAPDGSLNLQGIFREEEKPAPASPPKEAPAAAGGGQEAPAGQGTRNPVRIGKVTLQGGSVRFSDHFVKPSYSANLAELGGRVSGLSSEEEKYADVDLKGRLEGGAPLEITGKINPLRSDLYVDLKVDFKDIDLSPLSPYSGRYAGYTIQKGKLSLGLQYLIVKRKLDASNNVFLDQFTFGDRVDSPEATKLPVRLAVALLKDRKGEIRLDLPVSGSLDDPKFSIGRVILKIIVNILVKAATSPFALLGAIFGGGEELSYLEFAPGIGQPDSVGQGKLKTLEKALYDRPALKLEITGHVDMAADREMLRQIAFDRKVKAQKLAETAGKGGTNVSLDNVVVSPAEYPKVLKAAYKKEKFPKPRNFLGIAKDLPVPEMEKLMLTHIQITDDDLRDLAHRRAQAAKDLLLSSGRVDPERVFLVEPKTLSPEKKEKLKNSRVDFVIR